MELMEVIRARYSVRQFEPRQVARETLLAILEAGRLAPTGCNYQPFRIHVYETPEQLAKLNEQSKCIFGARTVLLFTLRTDEDWKNRLESGVRAGIQDVSIVADHIMLAAWDMGIGCCWVNYFANTQLAAAMGLPAEEAPVLLMPMGYPAADAAPLAKMHGYRKPLSELVTFDIP